MIQLLLCVTARVHTLLCTLGNSQPVISDAGLDEDLKVYLDKEVSCVDYSIDNGQPGLTLDLNCGKTEWTPVRDKKPIISGDANDELSVAELNKLDDVVFNYNTPTGFVPPFYRSISLLLSSISLALDRGN